MKYFIIAVSLLLILTSCTPAENNVETPEPPSEEITENLKVHKDLNAVLYAYEKDFPVDIQALYASGTDRGFAKWEDLPEYKDFFKNLDIPSVTAFCITALPSSYENESYTLTDDEAFELLSKFKEFELGILPESEYENVLTGGGWEWYLSTETGDWFFCYNGLWLSIVDCQTLERITYTLEWDYDFWESMDVLMAEKLISQW